MINTVALTGRLTRDPELRYTGSGIAVVSFTLAVNRNFKNASGEQEADFIMCQAWRKTAEIIAENLSKGSLIGVEGRIQTRNYQDSDGKTVYVTEVVVENMSFLESKNSNSGQNDNYQGQQGYNNGQNSSPANQNNQNMGQGNDPFESNAPDISDDDLPFDLAPMK